MSVLAQSASFSVRPSRLVTASASRSVRPTSHSVSRSTSRPASLVVHSRLPSAVVAASGAVSARPVSLVQSRQPLVSAVAAAAPSVRSSRPVSGSARSGLARSATVALAGAEYNSQIEQAIINSRTPIRVQSNAREEVQVGPYRGVHLNREEEQQFRAPTALPLSRYQINQDPNPEVIKKCSGCVKYPQEIAVRHLRPPTPPPHGDLVVRETRAQLPPGPPVVLRNVPKRAVTPPPQIFREAPPRPPTRLPTRTVEVAGTPVPPPARKVVLEKLPDQPAKPQNILIERWLPYKPQERRVVYQPACVQPPPNPRNLVIEWEKPCVQVEQVCKDLGVETADPEEYRRRFGCELKQASEIPTLCQDGPCQAASGLQRSASAAAGLVLTGDLEALRRVDLEREGLAEYRRFL